MPARPADQAVTTCPTARLDEVRRSGPRLRECPSCGKSQTETDGPTYFYSAQPRREGEFVVRCCALGTDSDPLPENVAEKWNRRADALTGSAPRLSAAQTHAIEDEVQKRGGRVVWGEPAPGAVETPLWDEIVDLLTDIREQLAQTAGVPPPDPRLDPIVKQIGGELGFGAMMCSASRMWRDVLSKSGTSGGEFVSGQCRTTVVKTIVKIDAQLSALKASARNAPVDATRVVDAAESWCRADDYRHEAATKELYAAVDAWRAAGGKRSRPLYDDEAPASPSAERILTQATDVEALTNDIVNNVCPGRYGDVLEIVCRHFPSSGGAAVVPSRDELAKAIMDGICSNPLIPSPLVYFRKAGPDHYGRSRDAEGAHYVSLATDAVLALLNPAPSTASASESEEKS
jgi:hypothetical protein